MEVLSVNLQWCFLHLFLVSLSNVVVFGYLVPYVVGGFFFWDFLSGFFLLLGSLSVSLVCSCCLYLSRLFLVFEKPLDFLVMCWIFNSLLSLAFCRLIPDRGSSAFHLLYVPSAVNFLEIHMLLLLLILLVIWFCGRCVPLLLPYSFNCCASI